MGPRMPNPFAWAFYRIFPNFSATEIKNPAKRALWVRGGTLDTSPGYTRGRRHLHPASEADTGVHTCQTPLHAPSTGYFLCCLKKNRKNPQTLAHRRPWIIISLQPLGYRIAGLCVKKKVRFSYLHCAFHGNTGIHPRMPNPFACAFYRIFL